MGLKTNTGPVPPPGVLSKTGPLPPPGVPPKAVAEELIAIPNVPGYQWRHGCCPTAAGMLLGYWHQRGFADLFPGDASAQTPAVDQRMASDPGNVDDYCEGQNKKAYPYDYGDPAPDPDRSEPPEGDTHADDSVADFMLTSRSADGLTYGSSMIVDIIPALAGYIAWCNPGYSPTMQWYIGLHFPPLITGMNWDLLVQEIAAARPVVLAVDVTGAGAGHCVTAVGYREVPARQYGCLDTWAPKEVVRWCDFNVSFLAGSPGNPIPPWSILQGITFDMTGGAPAETTAPPSTPPHPTSTAPDTAPPPLSTIPMPAMSTTSPEPARTTMPLIPATTLGPCTTTLPGVPHPYFPDFQATGTDMGLYLMDHILGSEGMPPASRVEHLVQMLAIFLANPQGRYEDVGTGLPPEDPQFPLRWQPRAD